MVETVGNSGLVYNIRPEKGGRGKILHSNSLKLCVGSAEETPKENPADERENNVPTPILYFPQTFRPPAKPAGVQDLPRRSTRANLGQLPARYRQ